MSIAEYTLPFETVSRAEGLVLLQELLNDGPAAVEFAADEAYNDLRAHLPYISKGSTRYTFSLGNCVVKTPFYHEDHDTILNMLCNLAEGGEPPVEADELPRAEVDLIWHRTGVPLVVMQKVTLLEWSAVVEVAPHWRKHASTVDWQVGSTVLTDDPEPSYMACLGFDPDTFVAYDTAPPHWDEIGPIARWYDLNVPSYWT